MNILPVDNIIPQILTALEEAPVVIIQAPPGSGKSTRIPLSLLGSKWLAQNKILMLEPRRLAALNLASWISSGIGEETGNTVGYSIRFDKKTSSKTRLEIVTEGILTRRLQGDPFLETVGAVIFDEFHERSIHTDTSLALCLYLQRTVRPDLRILIMSATLETGSISKVAPDAKIIACEGALHPVDIRYLGSIDEDPAKSAAKAVAKALSEEVGDILVFLPGGGEIRRCLRILEQNYPSGEPLILPLYGDLSFADQEKAIRVSDKRRVVLATNIAETSLTIDGVRIVVDSGLARRSRFDPSRALDRLVTERISKASATQRAGRSGRTAPGVCYRLWSEYQHSVMLPFDPPEILTSDLSELALNLALWGFNDLSELSFPDPPPASSLAESRRLLRLLSALDDHDRITERGRQLAELPLHPRLAALLMTAHEEGNGSFGADIAAIISERDFLRTASGGTHAPSDLLDRVDTLILWRTSPDVVSLRGDTDITAIRTVDRLSRQLRKILAIKTALYTPSYDTASFLVANAFPDRIAMQRDTGSTSYLLASGKGAVLMSQSGAANEKFIVAIRLDAGRDGDGKIYSALSIKQDQLKIKFSHLISMRRTAVWDSSLRRVTARCEEMLGSIILESRVVKAAPEDVMNALLEQLRSGSDSGLFIKSPVSEQYQARVEFIRNLFPEEGWPDLSDREIRQSAAEWLSSVIGSGEKFIGIDMLTIFKATLGRKREGELDRLAPVNIVVPSGSRIKIDYSGEGGPSISVKLQELFGLSITPCIADGKIPLLIHLLSPAGRPIQVTRDLRSFWDNGYQGVKKELKGRYPKHPWPDDPWSAIPTKSLKKRPA
jgi:ATP-dependent helicase HrpB